MTSSSPGPRPIRLLSALFCMSLVGGCSDGADSPPRPAEQRVQLFTRLSEFEVQSGFPNDSPRYLSLRQDSERAEDYARLRLFSPSDCVFAGPEVEIPAGARLELGIGVEFHELLVPDAADDGGARVEISNQFQIGWQPNDRAEAKLLATRVIDVELSRGSPRGREEWSIDLAAIAGQSGRITFHSQRLGGPAELIWICLPTWWSPVIVTAPEDAELGRQPVESVSWDLLHSEQEICLRRGEEWSSPMTAAELGMIPVGRLIPADRDTEAVPLERPPVGIEAHFEPGMGQHVARGGFRPAFAFASAAKITVLIARDAARFSGELRFEWGFHGWPESWTGSEADLEVRIDGERVWNNVCVADGRGWSPTVSVPLPSLESDLDEPVRVEFCVELEPLSTTFVGPWPIQGPGWQVEIDRPWFGVARPRLVTTEEIPAQAAAAASEAARRPNVLVLCVETLRADELGCYDPAVKRTPRLDDVATEALVFDYAYSPAPWTLPSVASYFSGLPPWAHGAVSEISEVLPDWTRTLAEAAREKGIKTAAFVSNDLLKEQTGFAAGYERYVLAHGARAPQLNQLLLDWLSEQWKQRFFAYVHYFEPHAPLNAPDSFRDRAVPSSLQGKDYEAMRLQVHRAQYNKGEVVNAEPGLTYLRGRYRGEVAYFDHYFGKLVDALRDRGLWDNTVIVLTSDHGEEFGEHRWYGHGSQLYEESIRVPLLVMGPGVQPGRVRARTSVLAAMAGAAEWLGIEDWALDSVPIARKPTAAPSSQAVVVATDKAIDLTSKPWSFSFKDDPERGSPRRMRTYLFGADKVILRWRAGATPPDDADLSEEDLLAALEHFVWYDVEQDPGERDPKAIHWDHAPQSLRDRVLSALRDEAADRTAIPTVQQAQSTRAVVRDLGYALGADDAGEGDADPDS